MKTTIDRFGRLVVPKELRERLGLRAGDEVEVDSRDQEIVLKPTAHEAPLCIEEGVLVYCGKAAGDIAAAVKRLREQRLEDVARRIHL
jgi:AbrB family looped-hinge helix DNA binding protein